MRRQKSLSLIHTLPDYPFPSPSLCIGTKEAMWIYNQEKGPHQKSDHAGTLIVDFQHLELWEINVCYFSHQSMVYCYSSQTDQDSNNIMKVLLCSYSIISHIVEFQCFIIGDVYFDPLVKTVSAISTSKVILFLPFVINKYWWEDTLKVCKFPIPN